MNFHILGPGRCGSSLVVHILNQHPDFSIAHGTHVDFLFHGAGTLLGYRNTQGLPMSTWSHKEGAKFRGRSLVAPWSIRPETSSSFWFVILVMSTPRGVA